MFYVFVSFGDRCVRCALERRFSLRVSAIPAGCPGTGGPPRPSLCECSLRAALPANLIYCQPQLPAGYRSPPLLSPCDQSQEHLTGREAVDKREKLCSHSGCIYYWSRMLVLLLLALFWLRLSVIIFGLSSSFTLSVVLSQSSPPFSP